MKKIAFITHSFHKKTKSANILAEEIFNKEDFIIDYFYIEDWSLNPVGFHNDIVGYDVVVIMQLISLEILNKIKCDHIVFIPMYDFSYSWDVLKWLQCINLKIVSPTKKTHDTLCLMGLNSYYIKYYPEPYAFIPGDKKKLFLWQRINDINVNTALELLNHFPIEQIFLHNVIDPGHAFVEPSQEDIVKYKMVFSDWFENKQEYLSIIKEVGIYMAPRLMEGGASAFIDAMKMGKVVIANNDAAMNEYITHKENGLLYDVRNVRPFDFNSIDLVQIQKNAYQSVTEGRAIWRKSIPTILNFIETKNRILISYRTLSVIRKVQEDNEALQKDKVILEQNLLQTEKNLNEVAIKLEKIKNDRWFNFGKLRRKEKIIVMIKLMCKKALGALYLYNRSREQ